MEFSIEYGFKLITVDGTEHYDILRFQKKEDAEQIAKMAVHPNPTDPKHIVRFEVFSEAAC